MVRTSTPLCRLTHTIVSNPERGFRQELHGACTGEGRVENGTIAKGLSLDEMSQACA